MNTQEEIEYLERYIETKQKELQSLKENMEFKVNYYINSMSVGNADYDTDTHKYFEFAGKIKRSCNASNTSGLLGKVDATLFMIQLADWANERYPEKEENIYQIVYDSIDEKFGIKAWSFSRITIANFINERSVKLAIKTINSNMQYIELAKIFLGAQS